ncbi:MAG: hypothetical protein AB7S26_03150 [Sandaracinaceae bacterium]
MLDPRDIGRSEDEDLDRFRRLTPKERLALFIELCDLGDSITAGRPDRDRLRSGEPRSEASEALWRRLMRDARGR